MSVRYHINMWWYKITRLNCHEELSMEQCQNYGKQLNHGIKTSSPNIRFTKSLWWKLTEINSCHLVGASPFYIILYYFILLYGEWRLKYEEFKNLASYAREANSHWQDLKSAPSPLHPSVEWLSCCLNPNSTHYSSHPTHYSSFHKSWIEFLSFFPFGFWASYRVRGD